MHIGGMSRLRIQQKRELINHIREFFTSRGFFELETPLLVPSPGMEPHLHGFATQYVDFQGQPHDLYLPTSPEFAIKKALGAGFDKVFEIARVFRNLGELGRMHHPEFNMLEWYRPGNYQDIMDDVTELMGSLAREFSGSTDHRDFSWSDIRRSSIKECFLQAAGLDLERGMQDIPYWREAAARALAESIPADDSFEDIFFRVWMKLIEPGLGKQGPEIVYDYPASMAALARLKEPENVWAERFEVYVQGIELGNAFSELTDSAEQCRRFREANQERLEMGYPPHPVDQDLIESVGRMSATGGIAIGVERLLMALTGETDIRECFLYPLGAAQRI